jgi:hypothetical protein
MSSRRQNVIASADEARFPLLRPLIRAGPLLGYLWSLFTTASLQEVSDYERL